MAKGDEQGRRKAQAKRRTTTCAARPAPPRPPHAPRVSVSRAFLTGVPRVPAVKLWVFLINSLTYGQSTGLVRQGERPPLPDVAAAAASPPCLDTAPSVRIGVAQRQLICNRH